VALSLKGANCEGLSTLVLLPKTATLYPETGNFVARNGDFVVFGNKQGHNRWSGPLHTYVRDSCFSYLNTLCDYRRMAGTSPLTSHNKGTVIVLPLINMSTTKTANRPMVSMQRCGLLGGKRIRKTFTTSQIHQITTDFQTLSSAYGRPTQLLTCSCSHQSSLDCRSLHSCTDLTFP